MLDADQANAFRNPRGPVEATGTAWLRWVLWISIASLGMARIAAASGELWFDELLSLKLVAKAGSVTEVLRLNVDNNHPLNSVWLLLLGASAGDLACRALAVTAGIGAMVVFLLLLRETESGSGVNRWQPLAGTFIFGCSYLQVLYASEARGYAPCVFFSLVAFLLLLRHGRRAATNSAPFLYGAACAAAVLSHPIGIQAVLGGITWSCVGAKEEPTKLSSRLASALRWHAAPAAFCVIHYVLFLRSVTIVGGDTWSPAGAISAASLHTFGIPESAGVVGTILVLAALTVAWADEWRRDRSLAAALLVTIVVAPCLALLVAPEGPRYPRYWLASCTFAQLLAACAVSRVLARNRAFPRLAVLALLAATSVCNAGRIHSLLSAGRASYEQALRHIRAGAGKETAFVGGDHDMRHLLSLERYAPRVARFTVNGTEVSPGPLPAIDFVSSENWPAAAGAGPGWLLLLRTDGAKWPPDQLRAPHGDFYMRDAAFSRAPLSGWDLIVYRKVNVQVVPSG